MCECIWEKRIVFVQFVDEIAGITLLISFKGRVHCGEKNHLVVLLSVCWGEKGEKRLKGEVFQFMQAHNTMKQIGHSTTQNKVTAEVTRVGWGVDSWR